MTKTKSHWVAEIEDILYRQHNIRRESNPRLNEVLARIDTLLRKARAQTPDTYLYDEIGKEVRNGE